MRIGDLVKMIVQRLNKLTEPDELVLGDETGTIIGIEMDKSWEDEKTKSVKVRWSNGKVTDHGDDSEADDSFYDLEVVTPRLYVNVYLWDRACGGPEEGGWYYDTYDPHEAQCVLCATEEEAERVADEKKAWCDAENADRYHPSSVLSDGHFRVMIEAWPAEPSPANTPHYC